MDPLSMTTTTLGAMNNGWALQVVAGFAALVALVLIAMVTVRWIIWPTFKGIGWLMRGVFSFVGREVRDAFRLAGALITSVVFVPLIAGSILIGRWSASAHFGQSLRAEVAIAGKCVYRLIAANFLSSFGMRDVVAGLEERVPQALADAPGTDAPRPKSGQFDGYRIVGSLPGGGSGGKLYIAEPDAIKVASFERNGHFGVGQVVVKVFSLRDGSSLPQIVRESRALDAARKLGLVLDHELTPDRFYYVMRFVPGQSLTAVTHQLHAASSPADGTRGLDDPSLRRALSFVRDLVATLDAYHRGGLWHKDVKPDNIIVDGDRAQLVDFGLVTPLRSAMTLTTHGTEYFRDPEMVKMALKGVKVHEVDGAKFDVYGAGAVLYSIIENSFPAHGVLSQITMRCPEALRWVVRRAMTEYDKRYPTAGSMLLDLDAIRLAADPMAVKPGQLPSMQDGSPAVIIPEAPLIPDFPVIGSRQAASPAVPPPLPASPPPFPRAAGGPAIGVGLGAGMGAGVGAGVGAGASPASAPPARPEIRLKNWVTGEFELLNAAQAAAATPAATEFPAAGARRQASRRDPATPRRSAREQLEAARGRAAAARDRVKSRLASRLPVGRSYSNNPNSGVYMAVAAVIAVVVLGMGGIFTLRQELRPRTMVPPSFVSGNDNGPELEAASPVRSTMVSIPGNDGRLETSPLFTVDGASVLVVVDLKKPLAPAHEAQIRSAIERLAKAGFEVQGDYPGADADESDLELTAGVIKAAEGYAVDSPNGGDAVGDWLAHHSELDLVLWFKPVAGQKSDGSDVTLTRVVIAPKLDKDDDRKPESDLALKAATQALR